MVKCTFIWISPALLMKDPFFSRKVIFQSAIQELNSIRMKMSRNNSTDSFPGQRRRFWAFSECSCTWLDGGKPSMMPETTYPRVIIVMETQTPDIINEDEARNRLFLMLKDETTKDLSTRFFALDVSCIFSSGSISNAVRFRTLKEILGCIRLSSDEQIELSNSLFSKALRCLLQIPLQSFRHNFQRAF